VPSRLRDSFDPREFLYPSNLLTAGRLLLLPLLIYFLRRPQRRRAALLCLAVAMFTDVIDGPIARRRGEVSRLGELLDPIADKLAIDVTAVALSRTRGFPWWVTALLLFRDGGIVLAALLVFRRRAQITTAKSMGKLTTLMLSLAMLTYIADGERSGRPLLYVALVPFGLSFVQYGREALRMLR
jgi:CDP-diacylglycerol--glycerol-3-phosphate 3-phosphatidyltransferase